MDKTHQKAIIEIENRKVEEVQEIESKPSITASSGLSSFANVTQKLQSSAKSALSQSANEVSGSTLGSIVSDIVKDSNADAKQFEVQFNPVSLKIHAGGKPSKEKTGADINHKNIDYGTNGVNVYVTVPLIFDGTQDNKNVNGISGDSVKENKVEEAVNQFLEAVRNPCARNIKFSWGNQVYSGQLYSVSTEYTMFSGQGRGIRATVTLSLLCSITAEDVEKLKENQG